MYDTKKSLQTPARYQTLCAASNVVIHHPKILINKQKVSIDWYVVFEVKSIPHSHLSYIYRLFTFHFHSAAFFFLLDRKNEVVITTAIEVVTGAQKWKRRNKSQ